MMLKCPSRTACTLTAATVLLLATTIFAQQFTEARPQDEATAKLVASIMGRSHISAREIDDDISSRLLKRYLKVLDPQKQYFVQSEIDDLMKYRDQLDDLLKVGNVSFAYNVFETYKKNALRQLDLAHKLIDVEHDFSADEKMAVDADVIQWAKSQQELDDRWRKRIKFDLINLVLEDTKLEDARERLHKRYNTLQRSVRDTENFETLEMYLSALTHCFDPHSSYMSPQTLEEFRISMELSLDGIGAALRSEDGMTTVADVVPGGAAEKDGRLKVGDKIVGVDEHADGNVVDIVEMKLSRVVRLIRGKRGTKVRLQIKKEDTGDVEIYELVRQKIELKSSEVKGEIIEVEERIDGRRGKIGVINIPSFYRDFRGAQRGDDNFKSTARDVLKVLKDFETKGGVDAVVVDLRTNGGGALSEAIEVSGLFIDKGPIVQVKESDGQIKSHDDLDAGVAYAGPLVVVCNRLSASASEIFAGAIRDYDRGIVVGDTTTHGKGTVQNVITLGRQLFRLFNEANRGALKLTINKFYRVNGDSTQNRGVESDVVLPSLIDHMDLGESFLDNALEFDRVRPAQFTAGNAVTPEIISKLKTSSQARVAQDEDFKELQTRIERYLARKNRKEISLNIDVLRKEREEDKKSKDDEKEDEDLPDGERNSDQPIFPDSHYNNEVLGITLDYSELLKGMRTAAN